jgi:FixJ family two-component response regulator/tRNA A-37 threonylcarbamoyl transferase component Bud32
MPAMRVLIIDDDQDLRNLLQRYIVQEWPDAAVEQFDPLTRDMPGADFPFSSYDVVILDYMLGRGDGLAWLREFKKRADCPPVIFLTGVGNEVVAVRAMKNGANDYLRKQELTRERLVNSMRDVGEKSVDATLQAAVVARMEGHTLGSRLQVPGIRILRLIGEGGMSRVYLASRESDDEPLVVKVLRPEVTRETNALERFLEEYKLIERIHSRHVAHIYGHGVSADHAYLVMEFFDGGDLMKRLAGKALPPEQALKIFRELMYALGDIHEQGVLHRDLKPQNLMFRADGSLAIVDFGIAKRIDAINRTSHGEVLGTPRYMSPEQVRGTPVDLRTDIYSAGVLLYQMLTGAHLFDGESAVEVALHHLNTAPPPLPERFAIYQRLLDRLLQKDRDARFRNADEVIGFLERKYFQDAPESAAPPPAAR